MHCEMFQFSRCIEISEFFKDNDGNMLNFIWWMQYGTNYQYSDLVKILFLLLLTVFFYLVNGVHVYNVKYVYTYILVI